MEQLNTKNLYRMPWSKNDNPNGWVEITTYCNMACPGCYRGCNIKNNLKIHKPLKEIKKEIILLKKIRNCQTISISGGEPLLHPDILKIVEFIREQELQPCVFTNGKLLTKDLLFKLKKAGLNGLTIRVDSLREPEKKHTEKELNKLRESYSKLIKDIGGIVLTLSAVVDKNNIKQISRIVEWFNNNENADILLLILKRDVVFNEQKEIQFNEWISLDELNKNLLNKFPGLEYNVFLGSQLEELQIKWVWAFSIYLGDKKIGYCDKKMVELMQTSYHLKNNKYFFIPKKNEFYLSFYKLLMMSFFSKKARKIFKRYILEKIKNPKYFFTKSKVRIFMIVNPPGFVNGERDLCDSCPDATFYKGKLVPSCLLEEYKKFKKPFSLKNKE